MEKLKAKLKKQGGFTLVEMLIVVAIIAILIAVSIPMFNTTLEKARHGVDAANARDAISMGNVEFLGATNAKTFFAGDGQDYLYIVNDDTHQGELILKADASGKSGVTPSCTCSTCNSTDQLGVNIKYGTDGKPNVSLTGWKYDSSQSKTVTVSTTP